MVALINQDQSKFFDVDNDRFSSVLKVKDDEVPLEMSDFSLAGLSEPFLAMSGSNSSTTLQLSHFSRNGTLLSTKGILSLISRCNGIEELSLPYSLLSDELIRALSMDGALHLQTLRVEAHPESKPSSSVSPDAWSAFATRWPHVNLVLLTYLTEAKDYDGLLSTDVPLTHLYFGENAPSSVIARVGERCPKLSELVVGAYGPDTIDQALINAARGCPELKAVGLGDCELTCSGCIDFVSHCCERLQVLYVLDSSLIEDSRFDITEASRKISSLLGKSWHPTYVPY